MCASTEAYDVALVGLGPVGSTAAILFADAGLKVVAFERDRTVYTLPRAVALDGEIVRAFQHSGRVDDVLPLLQAVRSGDRSGFANSRREWLFGRDSADFGSNGWQPLSMFDQPEFEGYLRSTAIAHPNVTAHIGATVTGFAQDDEVVTVEAASDDEAVEAIEIQARFMVGADGASSFVRKSLDVGWHDLGYDHEWLVVDVVALDGHTLTNDTVQVCDPERLVTYVCTKDPYRRWEFKLLPGETREEMLDTERIMSLIDEWTPRGTYELRRSAVYRFHAATADTWRSDRVFLAGDAAHQTPPFLGQGMNMGMRDVVNLAWKLPLVLKNRVGSGLLDTYQVEREAHALDMVEWAVAIGQLMEHLAAVEAATVAGEPEPATPARLQSSGYGQGRAAPPLRGGVIHLDQVSDTGSTGYLFSQPIVRTRAGRQLHLDALLGDGFAIVGRTDADLVHSPDSARVIDQLDIALVSLVGLETVRGHFDRLFAESGAAVVRPDRYVFGHTTDSISLDDLIRELATKLHLRRSEARRTPFEVEDVSGDWDV